jgi:hypothetical protein
MTWTLAENYSDSASRSYSAGEALRTSGDHSTSAHLYGVAAECAFKATLERAGIAVDKRSGLRMHLPSLISAILVLGHSRHMGNVAQHLAQLEHEFSEYSIDTRYAAVGCIDDVRCVQWQTSAKATLI